MGRFGKQAELPACDRLRKRSLRGGCEQVLLDHVMHPTLTDEQFATVIPFPALQERCILKTVRLHRVEKEQQERDESQRER